MNWGLDSNLAENTTGLKGSDRTKEKDLAFLGRQTRLRQIYGKLMGDKLSVLKSRDITWPTKVRLVKAVVFPVVIYDCENWTIKKAECWRIDPFVCDAGEDS